MTSLDTRLSPNFTLRELVRSQTADRHGIDNMPGDEEIKNLTTLCQFVLQGIRDHYGKPVRISSGYRCPELNRKIGSKDTSQHTKGQAADFEVPGISNLELWQWIQNNIHCDQVILEFHKEGDPNSGWVHASFVNHGENRRQAFKIP